MEEGKKVSYNTVEAPARHVTPLGIATKLARMSHHLEEDLL